MTTQDYERRDAWLIAVAAPVEAGAVIMGTGSHVPVPERWRPIPIAPGMDLVMTGVGKVNAAACVARLLPGRYGSVISLGIGGALPGSGLDLGDAVVATSCVYGDEGIETEDGFRDCAEMGFPLGGFGGRGVPTDDGLRGLLLGLGCRGGPIATVSTCSGTDGAAARVMERTGALVEAMEGAAVAHVAWELAVPMGELRVVSNTTGERRSQRWDLRMACERIARVIGQVAGLR